MPCSIRIHNTELLAANTDSSRRKQETYKDANTGLDVGERKVLWRDYANRVVAWVTTIGNIAMPFAPVPVSPLWSARRNETKEISGVLGYCLSLGKTADTSSFRNQTALDDKWTMRRECLLHGREAMQPWHNPIFAACDLGSFDLLEHLHRLGYDLTQNNYLGDSLRSIAAGHGHSEICSFLLDHGAKINTLRHDMSNRDRLVGFSALHHACYGRRLSTLQLLLSRGADPNYHRYHTPLCLVNRIEDSTEILSTLLDWKANPNFPCNSGIAGCCLLSALQCDEDETFRLLLKNGIDLEPWKNKRGKVLVEAAFVGAVKCSRILIEELGYDANNSYAGVFGSTLGAAALEGV
ncbi:ankyrin repeat-containing domain protein [Colletotrichum godetiae]|uniref:Ankyrin repeat-containing domain protein n=1 Tax=Colletotrichum godetiae TaxID=1209918 RepID=A0AAJ0B4G4_9PEZI|nr:ankyrin repeat-containing domain protein [Colletotrichum godetiae]KAK1701469.1 ankyrin repeat-containing domain protein [Colletotrichum godetiae]